MLLSDMCAFMYLLDILWVSWEFIGGQVVLEPWNIQGTTGLRQFQHDPL